jgi:hypothetical protein
MPGSIELLLRQARARGVSLWVTEGELRFRAEPKALTDELRAELKSRKQEIVQLLCELSTEESRITRPVFESRPVPDSTQILSYHKIRWENIKSGNLGPEFVNGAHSVVRIAGTLDLAALRKAADFLAARHSILTAKVEDFADGPRFVFDAMRRPSLRHTDLSHHLAEHKLLEATKLATNSVWEVFGSECESWWRIFVISISDDDHVFGMVIHHFIADGWSVGIVATELFGLYSAFVSGTQVSFPPSQLCYSDYVVGVNRWLASGGAEAHAAYWREHLRNAPPTRIPVDFVTGPEQRGAVLSESFSVPLETVDRLRELAKDNYVVLHAVVVAAVAAALAHSSGSRDIVVVTRMSGRVYPDVFNMVGAFFDAMAVRVDVSLETQSLIDLITAVQKTLTRAQAHQAYPFQLVKSSLHEVGASDIAPMMNFTDKYSEVGKTAKREQGRPQLFPLLPRPVELHTSQRYSTYYMPITADNTGIHGKLDYLSLNYRRDSIVSFLNVLCRLLEQAAINPTRSLASVVSQPA